MLRNAALRIRPATRRDCQKLGEIIVGATRSAFAGRVPEQCLSELPIATSVANWRRSFDSGAFDSPVQVLLVADTDPHGVIGFVLAGGNTAGLFNDPAISAA